MTNHDTYPTAFPIRLGGLCGAHWIKSSMGRDGAWSKSATIEHWSSLDSAWIEPSSNLERTLIEPESSPHGVLMWHERDAIVLHWILAATSGIPGPWQIEQLDCCVSHTHPPADRKSSLAKRRSMLPQKLQFILQQSNLCFRRAHHTLQRTVFNRNWWNWNRAVVEWRRTCNRSRRDDDVSTPHWKLFSSGWHK